VKGEVVPQEGIILRWLKTKGVSLFLREEAFFHSLRVCKRGFHDLFKAKPSLIMLSRWRSISITSYHKTIQHHNPEDLDLKSSLL
jgi:hypothetical protein